MIKKVTLKLVTAIILLNCSVVFSQDPGDVIGQTSYSVPRFAPDGKIALIGHPNGGYIYGTNNDPNIQITGIAQGYNNSFTNVPFTDVFFIVGAKSGSNQTSKLIITIYDTDPMGATNGIDNLPGPGTSKGTVQIQYKDVNVFSQSSPNYTMVHFTDTVKFTGKIIVGIDFSQYKTNGNSIGLFSDNPGSGQGLMLAFNYSDGTWYPTDALFQTQAGTGIDDNIAIFPVIAGYDNITEFKNQKYIFDTKAILYPNPAQDNAKLTIDFKNNVDGAKVEIIDSKGSVCKTFELGKQSAGEHEINLDLTNLKSGDYFYSIRSNNSLRYTKKFAIIK